MGCGMWVELEFRIFKYKWALQCSESKKVMYVGFGVLNEIQSMGVSEFGKMKGKKRVDRINEGSMDFDHHHT